MKIDSLHGSHADKARKNEELRSSIDSDGQAMALISASSQLSLYYPRTLEAALMDTSQGRPTVKINQDMIQSSVITRQLFGNRFDQSFC